MRSLGSLARVAALTAVAAAAIVSPATAAWTVAPGAMLNDTNFTTGAHCVTASACLLVGQQSGVASTALAATWNSTTFAQQTPVSDSSTGTTGLRPLVELGP
jgi:hypothetical protein